MSLFDQKMPRLGRSGKKRKYEEAKAVPVTTPVPMAVGLMVRLVAVQDIHSSLYLPVRLKCGAEGRYGFAPYRQDQWSVKDKGRGDIITLENKTQQKRKLNLSSGAAHLDD